MLVNNTNMGKYEAYKKNNKDATDDDLLKYTQKKFEKGWENRTNSIEFEKTK